MKIEKILETIDTKFIGKAVDLEYGGRNYLTDDGKKCAIGLFIPNGHDAQTENTMYVISLVDKYPDLLQCLPSSNLERLRTFQETHDQLDNELSVEKQKQILKAKAIKLFGDNNE